MKKSLNAKRIIAVVLALMMVFSAVPLVFAAPTGPVEKTHGNHQNGVDTGFFVSISADYQNFTFIQNEDNQQFQFTFKMGAKKNMGLNYGWIYQRDASHPQELADPIGKNTTCTWSHYQGGLPGNLFGGNNWSYADITVTFNAEGARTYSTFLNVDYDGRGTSSDGEQHRVHKIPLTVTVIDKRELNAAIAEAMAKNPDRYYYTEDTWSNLVTYLTQAQSYEGNVIAQQSVVDRAAANLKSAVEALTYKSADYSALDAAKAAAKPVIDTANADEIYTQATLKTLAEKYDAALAVSPDLDIRNQAEITKAAEELQAAVNALVKFANYSELQTAVNNFNKLNPKYFAADEFAKVKKLADKAKEDLLPENKLDITHQSKVDAQATELENAIAALELLPADYKAFDNAAAQVKAKLENKDIANYTDDTVKLLEDAYIASAKVEKGRDITYQATVDAAAKQLTDALAGLSLKSADYSKLEAYIAKAEAQLKRGDIDDFSAQSVQKLKTALAAAKAVDKNLTVEKQNVIDEALNNLIAATHLELKGADYSALDNAIKAREEELAQAKSSGKYTGGSMTRVQMAIDVAKSVDRTYSIKEQSLVDQAAATLNSVMLEKKAADTKNLEAAIKQAQETLNTAGDEYTQESKDALQKAIKEARDVLTAQGADIDNQEAIDAQVKKLQSVKLQLKGADYRELDKAIAEAEAFLANPETAKLYTPEAIERVRAALDAANAVDRNLTIKQQATVDAAVSNLQTAKPGENNYKPAELTALNSAIERANALLQKPDIADYTDESVNALKLAVKEAEAFLEANPNVTQQNAVNEKAEALDNMNLTLKKADYSKLETAVAQATIKLDEAKKSGSYTEESLKAYENALIEANALLDSRDLTIKEQKVVDAAIAALNFDMDFKQANLTALMAEIAKAQEMMNSPLYDSYTEDSRAVLEDALRAAQALAESSPNITMQDEVDAMAQRLAAVELKLKAADYSRLDKAIVEAQELLKTNLADNFTKESIEALRIALRDAQNVDRSLDITNQGIIDDAQAILENAMKSLVAYGKITDVHITHNGSVVEGDVTYEKVTWYKRYKKHSTVLGYETSGDVVDVKWELADWSVDNPEAVIVDNGDGTVTITPNGRGIGARSVWVKVTVTDVNGNTAENMVKVRFHKWNWQTR